MYIYLINCSIFYKIGFSKNPKNRLKTIKTHNPLDVKIVATLKTEDYLFLEKKLHNIFAARKTRGEWFELKEDDLTFLKIEYGFDFKIPINKIRNTLVRNESTLTELKELRIDNSKIDDFKAYFEDLYSVNIKDLKELKRCCLTFDTPIIKEAIDSLYKQGNEGSKAYSLLFRVCNNILSIKEDPSRYIVKIIKAIVYKRYKDTIHTSYLELLERTFDTRLDVNKVIKEINTKKFYLECDDFLEFILKNYTNE